MAKPPFTPLVALAAVLLPLSGCEENKPLGNYVISTHLPENVHEICDEGVLFLRAEDGEPCCYFASEYFANHGRLHCWRLQDQFMKATMPETFDYEE